jgi:hypothetical protein
MATWLEDVQLALSNLGGVAPLRAIYEEIRSIRMDLPRSYDAIIRRTIETNSSDSEVFGGYDLFFSVRGKGEGVWGLRSMLPKPLFAADLATPPDRTPVETNRIIRDTVIIRELKLLHGNQCQICGNALELLGGKTYSEGHHIRPLGTPDNGPDITENVLILCPNHHAQCDYGAIELKLSNLKKVTGHNIAQEFIDYHNQEIYGR